MFTAISHTAARTVLGALGTVVLAGTCLLGATAPAAAATPSPDVRVETVRYDDLNLVSSAGRAILDQRIRSAARLVCIKGAGDAREIHDELRCMRDAVTEARAAITAKTNFAAN